MNKLNFLSCNWLALKINNDSFLRHLHLIKGHVIDLGCGTSQYKDEILEKADSYLGVDWENCQHNRDNIDLYADLSKRLELDDNSADTVVSFQVLEHLPEPSIFLSECFRILKPDGYLILTVPFMWHVHEPPYDFYRFTRFGLEYLLKKSGFNRIAIEENTGFWQMWVLKLNYHTTRYAKGLLKLFFVPFWFIGQSMGQVLDKYVSHPGETASYTVVAYKSL